DQLEYVNRIVGDFTLDKRAADAASVLLVGTGTGLAPFLSMLKQLDHEAATGQRPAPRFTLVHANRTREELGYHEQLLAIEAAGRLDFAYVPSVSRPTPRDAEEGDLGLGRANNLLRHVYGMPLKEEADLREAEARGEETGPAQAALKRAVRP